MIKINCQRDGKTFCNQRSLYGTQELVMDELENGANDMLLLIAESWDIPKKEVYTKFIGKITCLGTDEILGKSKKIKEGR